MLATKCNGPMGADPNRRNSSRHRIVTAVEESLRLPALRRRPAAERAAA
ncbi:hypothetical protein AB0H42_24605 [Nocardia sp. NPDC050799]